MIYVERTIIINNNTAIIESPIVLYKGDKNVQILFLIQNNPFKYKNALEPTYGQLIVKRDKAEPIFSEVAKLSNNRVQFIVTEEMIDELRELGNYTFQIRLLNDEHTSRGTLPPVEKGIEIREPILEDEVPNAVGVSTINEVKVVEESGELEVFDNEGNYNKTNWQNGDVITDNKLNKIEQAIYEINENVDLSEYAPISNPKFTNSISLGRKEGTSIGICSVALGGSSEASGNWSTSLGYGTVADGNYSFASGFYTIANNTCQHVIGTCNVEDTEKKYIQIVGNGNNTKRSNAHTIDWDGNAWYSGKISQEGVPTEDKDLTTKQYVDNAIANIPKEDLSEYALKTDLEGYAEKEHTHEQYLEEHQDISHLATKEELNGKAEKEHEHSQYLTEVPSGYATETYVKNEIANAQLGGDNTEIDLSGYATKDDLTTKSDVGHTHEEYLTEHQNIDHKLDKEEGKSLVLDTEIERLATLKNYDDTEVRGLIEGKANEVHEHEQYLTEHQSLEGYAKTTDIPSIEGLATETFVTNAISNIPKEDLTDYALKTDIPTKTSELTNDSGFLTNHQPLDEYAKKEDLFSGDYNDLTNKPTIPSLEGYATEQYVANAISNAQLGGEEVDLSEYALKTDLNGYALKNHEHEEYLTEIPSDYALKTDIPSIEGLASEGYVDNAIANAPKEDLSGYALKTDLDEYAKKEDLTTVIKDGSRIILTTNKYQYVDMSNAITPSIYLPTVTTFTEIHLFFIAKETTINIYSDGVIKYQDELTYETGNTYEFIATYVPPMNCWLVGRVEYK